MVFNGIEYLEFTTRTISIISHIGSANSQIAIDGYRVMCQSTVDQLMSVACFKCDTDEIVGVSIVAVLSKDDHVEKQILEFVRKKLKQNI